MNDSLLFNPDKKFTTEIIQSPNWDSVFSFSAFFKPYCHTIAGWSPDVCPALCFPELCLQALCLQACRPDIFLRLVHSYESRRYKIQYGYNRTAHENIFIPSAAASVPNQPADDR